uniref:Spike protein n=1 Tax=Macrostomum lignano TaxID=282301 RepID=A0A1I8G5F5_9PLAT
LDGRYVLHAVTSSSVAQLHKTRVVQTYQRLEGVQLEIDYRGNLYKAVPIRTQVEVVASINLGTNQSVLVDFGNGEIKKLENFIEPMARTFRKLSLQEYEGNGTLRTRTANSSSPVVLLREFDFKQPTTVTQVQFHTFSGSSFQINVIQYRPMCSNVTKYCYYSNACIPLASKCNGTVRASACGSGSKWSLVNRACVNLTTGQVTRSVSPLFAGTYVLVNSVAITATPGLNLVNLNGSNRLEVLPGDIVGIQDSTIGLSEKAGPTNDILNNVDSGGVLTISPTASPGGDLAVQLFGYRQSRMILSTVYNDSFCSNESICSLDQNYTIQLNPNLEFRLIFKFKLMRAVDQHTPATSP